MTVEERNLLTETAKEKKDGVYSKKPYKYAVRDGKLVAYGDYFGNINRCIGSFDMTIGKVERYNVINELKKLI
jgi:hypothetical protein